MFDKLALVNKGAYGSVHLCKYKNMIKMVKVVKFDKLDCNMLKSVIRETYLLKNLDHPNLMNSNIIFIENTTKHHLKEINYIMEIYSHNLSTEMENSQEKPLTRKYLFDIITQIIHGIQYLHYNNFAHRDIKPENILVNEHLQIKITDYGISKLDYTQTTDKPLDTDYVQTLWYRAPEVFFLKRCDDKADMWSVGCIMFELMCSRLSVLFSYKSATKVLTAILRTFNIEKIPPSIMKIYKILPQDLKKDNMKLQLDYRIKHTARVMDEIYIGLMKKLLVYDPDKRYSAKQCLNHPYLDTHPLNYKKIKLTEQLKFIDNTLFENQKYKGYLFGELRAILHTH